MHAIIIFDVSVRQEEVISYLTARGYYNRWLSSETPPRTILLPKNAIWRQNIELDAAHQELLNAISALSLTGEPITLLRSVVLSVNPWYAIPGIP